MLLETGFFSIVNQDIPGGVLKSVIRIHPEHEIFKGHFPNLPIVPGVCMLQIVREIMEIHLHKKLRIREVINMKFLSPYNPMEQINSDLVIDFFPEDDELKITANLSNNVVTFFKLNAIFHQVNPE